MFNSKLNVALINFTLVCSVFLLSACTENNYNNNYVTNKPLDSSEQINKVKVIEYIVVLNKGVKFSDVVMSLKTYDIQLIKDIKRDRYVVGFKYDPGIEQLQKDIIGSKYIKHIQPNFSYKAQ